VSRLVTEARHDTLRRAIAALIAAEAAVARCEQALTVAQNARRVCKDDYAAATTSVFDDVREKMSHV
jgi:hypothetical protein